MKSLFSRLFGSESARQTPAMPASGRTELEIEHYSHGLVRIPALDYFGPHSQSSNGSFHLLWRDRSPDGSRGGYREGGHGHWMLLDRGGAILASGELERPQDGHVADNGNFILSDWMFGQGLYGRLKGFRHDGHKLFEREFSANIGTSALSPNGRMAICSTLNSPGSPDDCRHYLFDLDAGAEIASWPQETGSVERYEFDVAQRQVAFLFGDGDRVAYDFSGVMIDRGGWQRRRMAAGDLGVIRSVLEATSYTPDARSQSDILAGLAKASAFGDVRLRARALRLEGELREQLGDSAGAIAAYEKALALDPQVGVSRRLAKLERERAPNAAERIVSRFAKQANRLGIEHEVIELQRGATKEWRFDPATSMTSVEAAVLDHYRHEGWSGAAAEGGLILTLIKAASFDPLPVRLANTFIEAIYAQNVAFAEDRFTHSQLLNAIRGASRRKIEANWKVISATTGHTPAYYPAVFSDDVLGLFEHLGIDRLHAIAERFASASYDLRAGWPDLTLWREGEVRFVEVKAPGDSMHAKQARLISTLLVPLGFQVGLAEVQAR